MRILYFYLLLLCLCFQSSKGNMRHPGKRFPCCTKVSNANISSDVVGDTYRIQSAKYHCVKAIIFATQYGTVCVDPKIEWAQTLTANMTKL